MNYYNETQFVAAVDTHDTIIGSVEKWEAHKKGILHRAFTVAIRVGDSLVVQVRKHPVFDSVLDISCSSHPIFEGKDVQNSVDAAKLTLSREWKMKPEFSMGVLVSKGKVTYKANDPMSEYIEHEVCHVYEIEMPAMPLFVPEFAHGAFLIPRDVLLKKHSPLQNSLAPWVVPMLELLS